MAHWPIIKFIRLRHKVHKFQPSPSSIVRPSLKNRNQKQDKGESLIFSFLCRDEFNAHYPHKKLETPEVVPPAFNLRTQASKANDLSVFKTSLVHVSSKTATE